MDEMNLKEILRKGLAEKNMEISSLQLDQYQKYSDLLNEKNKVMNLTAIEGDQDIAIKHFLDSLSCLWAYDIPKGKKIIDVGTGAGFPALPVKIYRPDLQVLLLDSLAKRIGFLDQVVEELELHEVQSLHSRAEDAAHQSAYRGQFDFGVSRAVAPLNILLEYMVPFLKVGGIFLCQKGPSAKEEIKEAKKALHLLGCQVEDAVKVEIPFSELTRWIIVVKKLHLTSKEYPRKAGKPSKMPL